MNYRKLKGDLLFTGCELLDNNQVLIIKTAGEIVEIVNETDAGEGVETLRGIISPGFVNAHCHLELSHMKGLIPEKTGLVDFLYAVMNERHFREEEIVNAISNAGEQMTHNGIVATGDICNTVLSLPQKLQTGAAYYNFIETSGWLPSLALSRWERSKILYDKFSHENLPAAIVPHAPYSVSDDLWLKIIPHFGGKTITIHNQESIFENELFLKGTGDFLRMYEKMGIDNAFFSPGKQTSVQSYFPKMAKAASVILVHNTFISQDDIDYLIRNKHPGQLLSFCLCPNANLYIEGVLPPVQMLVQNNLTIVLGTDSLAANGSLNILDEMKTLQSHFPFLSLEKMLQWATVNGARALQMDGSIGSFSKGKIPGIVLIENVDGAKLTTESTVKRIV